MMRDRFGIGHVTIQIEGLDEVDGLNHGCNCASIGANGGRIGNAITHLHCKPSTDNGQLTTDLS